MCVCWRERGREVFCLQTFSKPLHWYLEKVVRECEVWVLADTGIGLTLEVALSSFAVLMFLFGVRSQEEKKNKKHQIIQRGLSESFVSFNNNNNNKYLLLGYFLRGLTLTLPHLSRVLLPGQERGTWGHFSFYTYPHLSLSPEVCFLGL